jgi:predicted enzyme related to lactoylglutathione lyase
MPRVIHFEVHAENPERAIKFYQGTLGWQFTKWEGPTDYWLIVTGPDGQPGINGGLLRRQGGPPVEMQAVNSYVCTVDVSNVDSYCQTVTKAGGQVVVPRMAIPGVGYLVYCKDTEGNIFGMMQPDAGAK